MSILSRFFLILAGLFVGLWLRGGGDLFSQGALPFLALLALVLAVAAAPGPAGADTKVRLEESYRRWLDAWHRLRAASYRERPVMEEELASASRLLTVGANDRVLKALRLAAEQDFNSGAVATLIIEMRRSIGRPSLTVRAAELERLLAEPSSSTPGLTAPAAPTPSNPVSFIS